MLNGQKKGKHIYPVMEVISMVVKVVPKVVKRAYVTSKGQRTVNSRTCNDVLRTKQISTVYETYKTFVE